MVMLVPVIAVIGLFWYQIMYLKCKYPMMEEIETRDKIMEKIGLGIAVLGVIGAGFLVFLLSFCNFGQ